MENIEKLSKNEKRKLALDLKYNSGKNCSELATIFKVSLRTVQRWISTRKEEKSIVSQVRKPVSPLHKQFSPEITTRILELKKENHARSAPMIYNHLKKAFPKQCPSISTIRKLIAKEGLSNKDPTAHKGYIKFERKTPNDLWQLDIAGVQIIGHLGKMYLIALLDDCSRYIITARYFPDEKGTNILILIKEAFLNQGRPNQILSDNGPQFRAMMKDVETKYTQLLKMLDVEPIFAKPSHPQTKGKLERWFGVIKQMWLVDEREKVKADPSFTLAKLNQDLDEWIHYYNYEKSHRSIPGKGSPSTVYWKKDRISRPLATEINWALWLNTSCQRKVTKYNTIKYEGKELTVPSGYSQLKVDVIRTENAVTINYKELFLITHPFEHVIVVKKNHSYPRKISETGLISWKGKKYTVDYKYKGKKVEVIPSDSAKIIGIYFNDILLMNIPLKE